MSRFGVLAVVLSVLVSVPAGGQTDVSKLPKYSGVLATEQLKVQGGTFDVVDDKGNSKTFEYGTTKAPKCAFLDVPTGRKLQPNQLGLGDEVTVAYKERKGTLFAIKVTRTKSGKHD